MDLFLVFFVACAIIAEIAIFAWAIVQMIRDGVRWVRARFSRAL